MIQLFGTFSKPSDNDSLKDLFHDPKNYKIIPYKGKTDQDEVVNIKLFGQDIKFQYNWEEFKKQQKHQDDLDKNLTGF